MRKDLFYLDFVSYESFELCFEWNGCNQWIGLWDSGWRNRLI